MKHTFSMLIIITLLFQAIFPSPTFAGKSPAEVRHAFVHGMLNLEGQYERIVECPDEQTWIPELGIRGLYCHVKAFLSYERLQALLSENIFVQGPHDGGSLNFKAPWDFGYYNVDVLKRLTEQVILPSLTDVEFVAATQDSYDDYLKALARSYYAAYQFLHTADAAWVGNPIGVSYQDHEAVYADRESIEASYLEHLEQQSLPDDFLQEVFREPTDRIVDESDPEWYNVNTAFGWWLRRSIDGSEQEFFRILELFLMTYDAEFFTAQ